MGLAGRPLRTDRRGVVIRPSAKGDIAARKGRHAVPTVPSRPPLRERWAARVKSQTHRLDIPRSDGVKGALASGLRHLHESILPNDPRDIEVREHSGEPVAKVVGAVDLLLLLPVVVLLVIGIVMVYSSSMVQSLYKTQSTSYYLFRQVEWLLIGGAGMYLAMRVDYRRWRPLAGIGLLASVALLLLLAKFGVELNGAKRWLYWGPVDLQPSEIAKVALVLYTAHWFSGQRAELRHSLRGLIPFGLVVGAVVALVFKQPDVGTTLVIVAALFTVYFVAGARLLHLALIAVAAVIGVKYYLRHLPHYQAERLQAWLHPDIQQHLGANYQSLGAQLALGTGGITGVGLGNGMAKFSLPEAFNDTIFAILGEEWGLLGTLAVLGLFFWLAWRGLRASMLAPDPFGRLLAAGLTCSIAFQALLNMAVVADAVPFTGVPLPFISYGGTSLSVTMVAAGILLNISKQAVKLKEERDPATAYLWWRHRRPHLSVAGRRAAPVAGAASSRQPASGVARRPTTPR